jgi:hypothetical protein
MNALLDVFKHTMDAQVVEDCRVVMGAWTWSQYKRADRVICVMMLYHGPHSVYDLALAGRDDTVLWLAQLRGDFLKNPDVMHITDQAKSRMKAENRASAYNVLGAVATVGQPDLLLMHLLAVAECAAKLRPAKNESDRKEAMRQARAEAFEAVKKQFLRVVTIVGNQ